MPLYTPAPMPPPLPPPLPRTPLLERSTNKGAGARGESAPVRMKTSLDLYKMRQLVDEQVNVAIRQQQRHYDQYQYRWWTQQTAACVSQNPAMKAPIVPAPKESDKENQRPEVNTAKTLASFPPDQAKRSAPTKNRTPRTAPAPVSRSIWPAPRRATCGEEDPHRSIWSISPFELGLMMIEALREERKKTKKKCSQPAVVGPVVAFGPTRVVEKATNESRIQEASLPSLHKYYSLPYMGKSATKALPSEKPNDADPGIPKSCDAVPQDQTALNYGKIFSLSVDTPVFYPKGGVEDSTELEQKKPAPHMDWWPGDWKCKKCGNHVLVLADSIVHVGWRFAERVWFTDAFSPWLKLQNFSYREKCKRCKWCRLEDPSCTNPPHSM